MNSVVAKDDGPDGDFTDTLQPGTPLLQGQYVIEGFLNSGGFGMTYLAKDSLDRTVVIKECFPATCCRRSQNTVQARSRAHQKDFKTIVRLFLQEARQLAKLDHPNIVGVHQVFEDNETAYMALDFVDGQDLLDIIEEDLRKIGPDQLRTILLQLLEAIGFIHGQDFLHRDISPDNILLDPDNKPVLIDFGAAREKAGKASRALSALLVVKDGYSPQEFYIAGSEQGPSSDLYALAATMYHLILHEAPPNSQTRLAAIAENQPDPLQPIVERAQGYDPQFLAAIDKALNIFPKNRFQTAAEWALEIDTGRTSEHTLSLVRQSGDIDSAISILVTETNQAVHAEIERIATAPVVAEAAPAPVSRLRAKFAELAKELAKDYVSDEELDARAQAERSAAPDDTAQSGDGDVDPVCDPDNPVIEFGDGVGGDEPVDTGQLETSDTDQDEYPCHIDGGVTENTENISETNGLPAQSSWITRYLRGPGIARRFRAFRKPRTEHFGKAGP